MSGAMRHRGSEIAVRIRDASAPLFGCGDRWSASRKIGAQKVLLRTFTAGGLVEGGLVLLPKLGKCASVIKTTVVN